METNTNLSSLDNAGRVGLDDEAGESFRSGHFGIRIGSSQHEIPIGHAAVRDPHLLTRDHILVAFLLGSRFDAGHVRACAWLSHTVRLHQNKKHPI